jgi:hypothetical protein
LVPLRLREFAPKNAHRRCGDITIFVADYDSETVTGERSAFPCDVAGKSVQVMALTRRLTEATAYPLVDANRALQDLRGRRIEGAAVIVP